MKLKCVETYEELYHQEPFDVAFCPYRISPLGAHIDHQYGKINGLAIDKGIHMAYHPKQNGIVELQSLNFSKRAQFFVNAVPDEKQGDWADHLRGAAKMLGEKYRLKIGLRHDYLMCKLELEKEIWLKKHDSIENVVEDIKENSATLDSALIPKRAQN